MKPGRCTRCPHPAPACRRGGRLPRLPTLLLVAAALATGACSGPKTYVYRYVPGKTAVVTPGGLAAAPPKAPREVHAAIAAGNRIAGLPYRLGGGHRNHADSAYDCSGATSYVLREAGLLNGSMPSKGFRKYGNSGDGKWISVYSRDGHVFLVVAGLRFDTGWSPGPRGPKWTTRSRPADRYRIRHPPGL